MALFPLLPELTHVELQAAALDGECYRLGEGFVPIGVPPTAATRAAAVVGGRSPRLVVALGSAAWVWGADARPPAVPEFLVDLRARWRPPLGERIHVVESVLREGDAVRLGGAAVTSPVRTAVDLARFRVEFGAEERELVRRLAALGGFGASEALATMDRGRNLSGKRAAASRLTAALSPS